LWSVSKSTSDTVDIEPLSTLDCSCEVSAAASAAGSTSRR